MIILNFKLYLKYSYLIKLVYQIRIYLYETIILHIIKSNIPKQI